MRTSLSILGITALLVVSGAANAAVWEVLYSGKDKNAEAKIELKSSSFRERLVRGEKIVKAHLRHYYREGRESTRATGTTRSTVRHELPTVRTLVWKLQQRIDPNLL